MFPGILFSHMDLSQVLEGSRLFCSERGYIRKLDYPTCALAAHLVNLRTAAASTKVFCLQPLKQSR